MKYIIGYALLCYIVYKIISTIQNKHKEKHNVQKNWREYYRKHPNTNIYYQARHKKEEIEYTPQKKKPSIIKFIIIVIVILYIIGKLNK